MKLELTERQCALVKMAGHWLVPFFFFGIFMHVDFVEVQKNDKKENGKCPINYFLTSCLVNNNVQSVNLKFALHTLYRALS